MRALPLLAAVALAALAGACASASSSVSDFGASLGTNVGRDVNPNGTQRRPDVYYGFTRPSLPTIANR